MVSDSFAIKIRLQSPPSFEIVFSFVYKVIFDLFAVPLSETESVSDGEGLFQIV